VGFKCCLNRELFKTSDIIMCRFVISSYLSWYNYYGLIISLISEEFSFETIMCRYVISSYLSWYNYVLIVPLVSEEFSFETLHCLHFSVVQFIHCVTNSELRVKENMQIYLQYRYES
jgi:hypothetical protein